MSEFDPSRAHELVLEVRTPTPDPGTFALTLADREGHTGSGVFSFQSERPLDGALSWGDFLRAYLSEEPTPDAIALFGRDLFRAAIGEQSALAAAWSGARGAAGRRPLALTVDLGRNTELFAALPFELLDDGSGHIFARPESSLRRTYQETPEKEFARPAAPRVLFAWACPLGATPFDPDLHWQALGRVFAGDRLERLDQATLDGLRQRLEEANAAGRPFHYLHLLAHGYRAVATAGVSLATATGAGDPVPAQALGQAIGGCGLELAFLCSCVTAVTGGEAFSGVGQQLLSPYGGDLPCVVATQANLPVRGSAELSELFYRLLGERGDPAAALARARREAFAGGSRAWSVPVLLARPEGRAAVPRRVAPIAGLPARRSTYLDRTNPEDEAIRALRETRLVSLVGLPGIGKTEIGRETARRAAGEGLCARVIYREAHQGMTADDLRALLGTALGRPEAPAGDEELAAVFAALDQPVLLVVDNAEDLMRTDPGQAAFRALVDALLAHAEKLRILLTTRWPVESTCEPERLVEVPPLGREETADLLERELRALGTFRESWPAAAAWSELIGLLDGHPRALWLVSRHFADPRTSLERVRDLLVARQEDAVVAPDLLGREDAYQALSDDKRARLRSLVATMDLSFEALADRHPDAVEAFVALSLFPGGLPENVAREVCGGAESLALDHLYHYHLVQWHAERTFIPCPCTGTRRAGASSASSTRTAAGSGRYAVSRISPRHVTRASPAAPSSTGWTVCSMSGGPSKSWPAGWPGMGKTEADVRSPPASPDRCATPS